MPEAEEPYVENDTLPELSGTYPGADLDTYESVRLHIKYKPHPLRIDAVVDGDAFSFPWRERVTGVIAASAVIGATTIDVTVTGEDQDFADLPDRGELVIGTTHILYTAKSAPATLTLATPLLVTLASGTEFEKLPDLRAGNWKSEVELVDADGKRITFNGLVIEVQDEIL